MGENDVDTDNQQGTPTEAEIAWLAGVLEGEGSFALSMWKRDEESGSVPKASVTVKLYNTDAGLVKKAVEIIRRLGIAPYIKEREQKPMQKPGGEGHYCSPDPMLVVTVSKLEASLVLLKTLRPWLFGNKAARADLMIAFLEQRLAKHEAHGVKRVPYDGEDIRLVADFYSRFTRVGIPPAVEGLLNEYRAAHG